MKTLKGIQVLSKIGKVMCKVIYVCCIVGVCGCIVGMIALPFGVKTLKFDGVTLENILQDEGNIGVNSLYIVMTVGIILCVGEGALAKIAEKYFTKELSDGTPFTRSGAKQLFWLGVWTMALSLGSVIVADIVQNIMQNLLSNAETLSLERDASIGLGIAMLVVSYLCRYGAELNEEKQIVAKNQALQEKEKQD